jgi:dipeptidyl aminopeptidase/acylaminoacyl peptidase
MKAGLPLILLAAAACAQEPPAWSPELSMRVQPVGDVTPSPDGKLVAYIQSRAVMEPEKSEIDTQIFLARADGSHRVQLTRGEKSATSPSFSPNGHYVYFSSDRSGKPNIWRIPVDGGEAEMLTDWKGEIGTYHVSPDGKWVAFTGMEPRPEEEEEKKEKRDFRVVDENPKDYSLWIIPAEPDSQGKRAARKVCNTSDHVQDFDWSPDSQFIAFAHTPTPSADDWTKSDISEVAVESGEVRPVAATGAAEMSPHYSPDGRYLAFVRTTDPARWAQIERVVMLPRKGGESRELSPTYDERPALIGWSGDSERLLFTEPRGTTSVIYQMPLDGPAKLFYEPEYGTLQAGHLNTKGTAFGFAAESWDEAPEAYVLKIGESASQRVSAANTDLETAARRNQAHHLERKRRARYRRTADLPGRVRVRQEISAGVSHPRRAYRRVSGQLPGPLWLVSIRHVCRQRIRRAAIESARIRRLWADIPLRQHG